MLSYSLKFSCAERELTTGWYLAAGRSLEALKETSNGDKLSGEKETLLCTHGCHTCFTDLKAYRGRSKLLHVKHVWTSKQVESKDLPLIRCSHNWIREI
ncbi:hypothetical protein GN956_G11493 [Arapaima gigas]